MGKNAFGQINMTSFQRVVMKEPPSFSVLNGSFPHLLYTYILTGGSLRPPLRPPNTLNHPMSLVLMQRLPESRLKQHLLVSPLETLVCRTHEETSHLNKDIFLFLRLQMVHRDMRQDCCNFSLHYRLRWNLFTTSHPPHAHTTSSLSSQ